MSPSPGRVNIIGAAIGRRAQVGTAGLVVAGAVMLAGAVVVAGHLAGVRPFLALIPGPRTGLGMGLAIVGLGMSLWTVIRGAGGQLPIALSALVLLGGLVAIGAQATGAPLAGQSVSVTAALILATSAFALLIVSAAARESIQQVVLGIAGLVLVSLSITIGIARTAGVLDLNVEQQISGAPLPILLTGILLGGFFLVTVLNSGVVATDPPRWLAGGAGIATLVIVLLLWLALAARERIQIRAQTRLAVNAERLALLRHVESIGRAVLSSAVWAAGGVTPRQFQERFAVAVRDNPGLIGGAFFPPPPLPPVEVPGDTDVATLARLWTSVAADRDRAERLVYQRIDPAARRIAVMAGVCGTSGCGGGIVGVIDPSLVFRSAAADTANGFHFLVAGPGGPVAEPPEPASLEWREAAAIDVGDSRWTVTAWPTAGSLERLRSDLPATVLFMGLIVAGLLPLTLRFAQAARASARQVAQGRLASALERATDGVWELDVVRGTAIRSAGLLRYLSYEPEIERNGDRWFSLVHPDDQRRVNLAMEKHLAGETERFEVEYRLKAGDGHWHRIVDRGRVVDRTAGGRPVRVLGISADVTEATAVAVARAESESRFRAIFDSAFHIQLVLDTDGTVVEVNRAALALSEQPASAVIDRPCWTTLWWADNPAAAERLREAVNSGRDGRSTTYTEELRSESGVTMILELAVTPIRLDSGPASQLLLEGRDETARRRAEAALQEVSTLTTMGRLAARVAHEINNPLAGIQNAFLLLKDAVTADHPHRVYVGAIEREIARIAGVTRQLYETYRPETESTPEASVATVIGDAVALLSQLNKRTGVRVEAVLKDLPAVVPLPSALVRQVVFNLLQNAFDASPPDSVVIMNASASVEGLVIRVRDQGSGVPEEIEARIFEPFFTTKGREVRTGGMGIGLSLIQRSAAAVGGRVSVCNVAGGGAEFVVELPFETSEKASRG